MLGKLQTYKLQPTKFYEKGYRVADGVRGRRPVLRDISFDGDVLSLAWTNGNRQRQWLG